jgi:hypothetical protein
VQQTARHTAAAPFVAFRGRIHAVAKAAAGEAGMNYVEMVLRLAAAAVAAGVVAAALPASRAGAPHARLVVAGATGAACLEFLAAANVLLQSPVVWTFTRVSAPLAYIVLGVGLLRLLRAPAPATRPAPVETGASPAPPVDAGVPAEPPPVRRPPPSGTPSFLR